MGDMKDSRLHDLVFNVSLSSTRCFRVLSGSIVYDCDSFSTSKDKYGKVDQLVRDTAITTEQDQTANPIRIKRLRCVLPPSSVHSVSFPSPMVHYT